ncbi:hypothetical protein H5410_051628 [Solanum commersonii]|uniref:Uncharacterized protein n=1 Tax=Solanum commersonii TaxID=4109 RepID=A0A9J5WYP0_SOLCO|nr:hypothetical protein H5410_051628 [Solanum commersonii]
MSNSSANVKELKCKLRKYEEEVKVLPEKRKNEKANSVLRKLTSLTMEDHTLYKELPPDMVMFATHLYNEGYFKDSNFTCFENIYALDFVKYVVGQFGRDHKRLLIRCLLHLFIEELRYSIA